MKALLALIDFSDVTPQILEQTEIFAKAMGAEVTLLHAVPPWPVAVDFAPAHQSLDEFQARQQQLLVFRDSLAARGISISARQFEGSVMEILFAQIGQLHPDMIIMGSHGHGALYDLVVGSVTAGVLKHAPCPILLVPCGSPAIVPVEAEVPVNEAAPQAVAA